MQLLVKILLLLTFPLLLLARAVDAIRGRDPLQLREPRGTCWIARTAVPSRPSYFSEASELEGRGHSGAGRLAAALLRRAARLFVPRRKASPDATSTLLGRDPHIPDEVYTLW
jgi:hypothetical protein